MTMFADTFVILNKFGFELVHKPDGDRRKCSMAQLWHSIVSVATDCSGDCAYLYRQYRHGRGVCMPWELWPCGPELGQGASFVVGRQARRNRASCSLSAIRPGGQWPVSRSRPSKCACEAVEGRWTKGDEALDARSGQAIFRSLSMLVGSWRRSLEVFQPMKSALARSWRAGEIGSGISRRTASSSGDRQFRLLNNRLAAAARKVPSVARCAYHDQ